MDDFKRNLLKRCKVVGKEEFERLLKERDDSAFFRVDSENLKLDIMSHLYWDIVNFVGPRWGLIAIDCFYLVRQAQRSHTFYICDGFICIVPIKLKIGSLDENFIRHEANHHST